MAGRWRAVVLSLVVSVGFLYLALRGVDLHALGAAISAVDLPWVGVAVVVSFLIMIFRAWRWQLELRPLAHVPFGRALGGGERGVHGDQPPAGPDGRGRASLAAVAAYVRQLLERRRQPHRREDLRLGGDRLLHPARAAHDARTCRTGCGPGRSCRPWRSWRSRRWSCCSGGAASSSSSAGWSRWLPERFGAACSAVARSLVDGMRVLGDPRLVLAVFAVSLALWFLPILSSWVMIQAFHLDAPFNAALAVFILIGFGTALPQPPGHGRHLSATPACWALGLFGVAAADRRSRTASC